MLERIKLITKKKKGPETTSVQKLDVLGHLVRLVLTVVLLVFISIYLLFICCFL